MQSTKSSIKKSNLAVCEELFKIKKNIEMNFLVMGEHLKEIRDEKMYEGRWETFDDFLMELDITKSTASKIITTYDVFVDKWNFNRSILAGIGYSKLYLMASHVRDLGSRKEVADFIQDASVLSFGDLSKNMREEKTGVSMSKCKHKDSYLIRICRDCGDKIQEFEDEDSSAKRKRPVPSFKKAL